jgi:hypothetical protein
MNGSPLDAFLRAVDDLDADAVMALMAPDCRLLTADGRRAVGTEAVRALIDSCLATLHSATHRVTAEWHVDGVWIAEVDAGYEFKQDRLRIGNLPRAFVARGGPEGLDDLRVYGAHEGRLDDESAGGLLFAGQWLPPL